MPRPTALKHTSIIRKPGSAESTRRFKPATDTVHMYTGYDNTEHRQLWLAFTSSASGGTEDTPGRTNYRVLIGIEDYPAILEAMCKVDREATLLAAASVLVPHLTAIKEERDAVLTRKAKERAKSIPDLAQFLAQSR